MRKALVLLVVFFTSFFAFAQDAGDWLVLENEDLMSGVMVVNMTGPAEVFNGCLDTPFIVIRKGVSDTLEVFIHFGGYRMNDDYNLSVKFGNGAVVVWESTNSTSGTAVFINYPERFIEEMLKLSPTDKVVISGIRASKQTSTGRWVVGNFTEVYKSLF